MISSLLYAMYADFMDNLVSFPHQLASVVYIGTFTFESMLIEYLIRDGVIPTYIDGLAIAKAYDFIPCCYDVLRMQFL